MNPLSPYLSSLSLSLLSISISPLYLSLLRCPGSSPIPTIRVDTTADTFLEVDDNCSGVKYRIAPLKFLDPLDPLDPHGTNPAIRRNQV